MLAQSQKSERSAPIASNVPAPHTAPKRKTPPPVLRIDLNKENSTKEIAHDGDIELVGSLRSGRKVTALGSIKVSEAVEAVELKAGGDLTITGGIVGGETGRYEVAGEIRCRFIAGGQITAGGSIEVEGEIAHAQVCSAGRIIAPKGIIYGGLISANAGIICNSLGKAAGATTVIEAGVDQLLRAALAAKVPQIEANRKHVREVRSKLEPLLKQQRTLSREQRERATELLWEAGELDKQTDSEVADLMERDRSSRASSDPTIVVEGTIFPGVTVRFPGVEAVINSELKGPISIKMKSSGSEKVIVAIDQAGGQELQLETKAIADEMQPLLNRIINSRFSDSSMRAKCIRAFVAATDELFKTMIRLPLALTKPRLKESGERIYKLYRVSSLVEVSGNVEGSVWISFSEKVALAITGALAGQPFRCADDPECRDALAEIANMIVGAAKRKINEGPLAVSMPSIHLTEQLVYPPKAPIILLPFDTSFGRFVIEFALREQTVHCAN